MMNHAMIYIIAFKINIIYGIVYNLTLYNSGYFIPGRCMLGKRNYISFPPPPQKIDKFILVGKTICKCYCEVYRIEE